MIKLINVSDDLVLYLKNTEYDYKTKILKEDYE